MISNRYETETGNIIEWCKRSLRQRIIMRLGHRHLDGLKQEKMQHDMTVQSATYEVELNRNQGMSIYSVEM